VVEQLYYMLVQIDAWLLYVVARLHSHYNFLAYYFCYYYYYYCCYYYYY